MLSNYNYNYNSIYIYTYNDSYNDSYNSSYNSNNTPFLRGAEKSGYERRSGWVRGLETGKD